MCIISSRQLDTLAIVHSATATVKQYDQNSHSAVASCHRDKKIVANVGSSVMQCCVLYFWPYILLSASVLAIASKGTSLLAQASAGMSVRR